MPVTLTPLRKEGRLPFSELRQPNGLKQQCSGQPEQQQEAADVGEGRDENRGGDRGVYAEALEHDRDERAGEPRHEQIAGHREEDHDPERGSLADERGDDADDEPMARPLVRPTRISLPTTRAN